MGLGERLRVVRERLGASQADFAALVGASRKSQIRWEQGESAPDARQLVHLLATGVDVPYVLTGVETDKRVLKNLALAAEITESADVSDEKRDSLRLKLIDASAGRQPLSANEWAHIDTLRRCAPGDQAAIRQMAERLAQSDRPAVKSAPPPPPKKRNASRGG